MTRYKFADPTGPGTSPWHAYDKAIEAWHRFKATKKPHFYKRYYNQRQYMTDRLRKEGMSEALIKEWCMSLDNRRWQQEDSE